MIKLWDIAFNLYIPAATLVTSSVSAEVISGIKRAVFVTVFVSIREIFIVKPGLVTLFSY